MNAKTKARVKALVVLLALLVVCAVVFGPMLMLWTINTLWGIKTPLTWTTWFAALLFTGLVGGSARATK